MNEELIKNYKSGKSARWIMKNHKITRGKLKNLLLENNIKIRGKIDINSIENEIVNDYNLKDSILHCNNSYERWKNLRK